ncbi:MAG: adenylosuccinate synthetase [Clostridia bacterium]
MDPLCGIDKLKVCVAYDFKGKRIEDFPADFSDLEFCTPIYEEFEGFTEDISTCKTYEELPKNVKIYIEALEKMIDCPVKIVGNGPARDQIISK